MENLRQLRAFVAVADCGSAARAGLQLNVSQPSVSAAISGLERSTGVRLFERGNRGMAPTPAARALLIRVRAAFAHLDTAEAQLRGRSRAARRWAGLASAAQLRSLGALAETRGLSSAARALGVTEPSIHRALRTLEARLGVPLWRSAGPSIEPTPEALIVARAAGLCASEIRMGFEELRERRGEIAGRILVGALPMPRAGWLPRALRATLAVHPAATVEVMDGPYEQQLAALRAGRIDVLLGALRFPQPGSDVVQEALFQDPLSIVVRAGHPLLAALGPERARPTAAQLRSLSWLLPPLAAPARQVFEHYMARIGAGPARCLVECNSFVTIRTMLLESDSATPISSLAAGFELGLGQLAVLGPPVPGTAHSIGIATRRGFRPTALVSAFLDEVRRNIPGQRP